MRKISIKKLEETSVTSEDIFLLIKEVFSEREKEGIHVSYNDYTIEDIQSHIKDAIVIVALDEDSSKLVGTGSVRLFKEKGRIKECGYGELLAVSSSVQGLGIGSQIIKAEKIAAEELGLRCIKSDTSVKATSSVMFHKKNGYIIDGFQSSGLTNTYSYTYRLPIKPSLKDNRVFCHIRFILSYIIIKISKDAEGNYYPLGKLLRMLRVIS